MRWKLLKQRRAARIHSFNALYGLHYVHNCQDWLQQPRATQISRVLNDRFISILILQRSLKKEPLAPLMLHTLKLSVTLKISKFFTKMNRSIGKLRDAAGC